MFVKYVRDDRNHPFATIATIDGNAIGVSICNPKDTFNKRMGRNIAMGRARAISEGRDIRLKVVDNQTVDYGGEERLVEDVINLEITALQAKLIARQ